jgi:deoxyadenosine/deoxycytidine kinase
MANIRKSNRSFERPITKDYLRILNEAYNQFFINYRETPLLIINSTEIDFVNNLGDFEELVRRISQPIAGTEFYSPIKI